MAFATQNVHKASIGNLKVVVGEWTGAEGDANGSVIAHGSRVWFAQFTNQDATSQEDKPTPYSVSVTGSVATLAVANRSAVTNGRFIVVSS